MKLYLAVIVLSSILLNLVYSQDENLVGRWEHTNYPAPATSFTFKSDGTFEAVYALDSGYECFRPEGTYTTNTKKTPKQIDLTWTMNGNRITVQGLYELKKQSGKEVLTMDFGCDFCYVMGSTSRPSGIGGCAFSMYEYVPSAGTDANLVGNWAHPEASNASRITFGNDGSFSYSYDCGWETVAHSGSYQIVDANKNPKWIDVRFGPNQMYYEQEIYSITTKNGKKELQITTNQWCTPYTPPCTNCRPTQFWSYETATFVPGAPSTTGSTGRTTTGTTGRSTTTTGGGGNCGPTMTCQECTDACSMTCKYTGCALDLCNSDCRRYNCGKFCGGKKRLVTYEIYE